MKKITPLLLCALSGLLLSLAFPPCGLSLFVWIALIPLFAVLWTGNRPQGFKGHLKKGVYGYIFGLFFFGSTFWWINEVSSLGFFPLTLYLSLFPALWSILAAGIFRPRRAPFPGIEDNTRVSKEMCLKWSYQDMGKTFFSALYCAAAWVVIEWLRGYGEVCFPWNYMGAALPITLQQGAEWIGAIGLSALPLFINALLWAVGSRIFTSIIHNGRRSAQWDFLMGMSAIAVLFLWGTWRMASVTGAHPTTPLSVLLVQENTPQFMKWDPAKRNDHFHGYMESTQKAIKELEDNSLSGLKEGTVTRLLRPHWVIWPESAIPWPLEIAEGISAEQANQQPIAEITDSIWKNYSDKSGPLTLIAGLNEVFWAKDGKSYQLDKVYNALFVFNAPFSGKKTIYRKKHLVPFGEYIPLRDTIPLLEKAFAYSYGSPMGANMTRGTSVVPMKIKAAGKEIQVIPTICFEDTVASHLRPFVRTDGPQIILNVTNDGWFNKSWANEQHFRNAKLRAIELRRPMIRAANTGISAIIGADGQTYSPFYPEEGVRELRDKDGSPFIKGTLFGTLDIPLNPELTLYALLGDWFVIWCLIFLLFGIILPHIKRSRSKGNIRDGIYIPKTRQGNDATISVLHQIKQSPKADASKRKSPKGRA